MKLSICIEKDARPPFGSITPDKASFRDFSCLRQLEFPLQIALCNIIAAACRVLAPDTYSNNVLECDALMVGDLVPAMVSVIPLFAEGKDDDEEALDVTFRDFASRKQTMLPALKEIHLNCPDDADDAYKRKCTDLIAQTQKVGVNLYLERYFSGDVEWCEEHC